MIPVIDTSGGIERTITCPARVTFNPILRFFQDKLKNVPLPLAGNVFYMQVRNSANEPILSFELGNGLEIVNSNQLKFLKSKEDMDLPKGIYKYDLLATKDDVTRRLMYGDFIVSYTATVISVATP